MGQADNDIHQAKTVQKSQSRRDPKKSDIPAF